MTALNESLRMNQGAYDAYDLYFLAMCYQRLGDGTQARSCYERAVVWHRAHTSPPSGPSQELDDFRAEAEAVLKER